jgi:hypothetical protein
MIISHKHKYIFVQLPRTGTTSIGKALVNQYDGERASQYQKHVTYDKFLRHATDAEKDYFVFSCIRNPLDKTASLYFKYKSDHHDYLAPKSKGRENFLAAAKRRREFRFVRDSQADFGSFFRRFYRLPYDDWSCLSHQGFDYIIRFENLEEDFAKVLEMLRLEPRSALPESNRTAKDSSAFLELYTPDLRGRAKWVFGPYMEKWGYKFPSEWGNSRVTASSRLMHSVANIGRKLYWRYLR